jgi:peptide/nickel transport system substrate-binding protein
MVLTIATACAAPSRQTEQSATSPATVRGPKVLTVGELREPATIFGFTGEGGSGGGAGTIGNLLHDTLTQLDAFSVGHPSLAVEVPSVERGTWQINADGSMDVTWKLKPGVQWQDGAPFTSDDLMFTLALNKDTELQTWDSAAARLIRSATNPDPLTFLVHWSRIDIEADQGRALTPMPRHILEDLYKTDKQAFENSPHFREQFIGLGPYRLTAWERGSHAETVRFDGYHAGRPALDRVVVRYIPDENTMVANILAGSIDVIMPKSVDLDGALQLRRQWEGTGNLVRIEPLPRFAYMELMFKPEFAKPLNGLPNLAVRQGLSHALDRAGLAEVATGGLAPPSDSWIDPKDPLRAQLEDHIVKYPFDLNRAQQLISQGGWTRGADGILVHTSGERFDMEVWVNPQTSDAAALVVADNWKRVGGNTTVHEIPAARANDREYQSRRPGPLVTGTATTRFGIGIAERYDGRDIAGPTNQWAGRNRAGYMNGRADTLLDQLKTTIDARQRVAILQEQLQIYTSDVVLMPLYWEPGSMMAVKGVKVDIHPNAAGFHTHLWDRE